MALLSEKEVTVKQVTELLGFMPWGLGLLHIHINSSIVDTCQRNNTTLLAWTVNTKEDFERLRKLGVLHIITDFPDLSF
jgi:glycerophosphoryl diester phosphodiesterase